MSSPTSQNVKSSSNKTIDSSSLCEDIPLFSIFNRSQMEAKYKKTVALETPVISEENITPKGKTTTGNRTKSSRGKRVPLSPVNKSKHNQQKPRRSNESDSGSSKRGVKRDLDDKDYVFSSGTKHVAVGKRNYPRRKIVKPAKSEYDTDSLYIQDTNDINEKPGEVGIDREENEDRIETVIGNGNTSMEKNKPERSFDIFNVKKSPVTLKKIPNSSPSIIKNLPETPSVACKIKKYFSKDLISEESSNTIGEIVIDAEEYPSTSKAHVKLSSLFCLNEKKDGKSSRKKNKTLPVKREGKCKSATIVKQENTPLKNKSTSSDVICLNDSDFEPESLSTWYGSQANKSELCAKPEETRRKSTRLLKSTKTAEDVTVTNSKSIKKRGRPPRSTEKAGTSKIFMKAIPISKSVEAESLKEPEETVIAIRSEESGQSERIKKKGRAPKSNTLIKPQKSQEPSMTSSSVKNVKLAPIFAQAMQSKSEKKTQVVKSKEKSADIKIISVIKEPKQKSKPEKIASPIHCTQVKPVTTPIEPSAMSRFVYKVPIEATLASWAEFQQVKLDDLLAGRTWQGFNTQLVSSPKLEPLIPKKRENLNTEFQRIKAGVPHYPVYRCFKMMRERNGYNYTIPVFENSQSSSSTSSLEFLKKQFLPMVQTQNVESTLWTEKYKPTCSAHILTNARMINQLKDWLLDWVRYVETEGSGDFDDLSDAPVKCILLRGLSGTGKTSAVYAIAEELQIKILEMNASCKRSRKHLEKQLMEATQSHQVSASKNNKTKMCLLLIEDADLIFEEDEGFIRGLNSLLILSKRPVIMVTTDTNVPHLEKYVETYPVLTFFPSSGGVLATYFQIMCLVEGLHVDPASLRQMLYYFHGDARRTTLQLQFWLQSGGDSIFRRELNTWCNQHASVLEEGEYEDFQDGLFLESQTGAASSITLDARIHRNAILSAMIYGPNQLFPIPIDATTLWWNISNVLRLEIQGEEKGEAEVAVDERKKLANLSSFYDTLSSYDVMNSRRNKYTEKCSSWDFPNEQFMQADQEDIQQYLLEADGRRVLDGKEPGAWNFGRPTTPNPKLLNRQKSCNEAFFEGLPLHMRLNRKAFQLDYAPVLRNMARTKVEHEREFPKRHKQNELYFEPLGSRIPTKHLKAATCPYSFLKDND